MFDLIAGLVAWFYSLWPSYGFAIIMLTLTVMVVVTPLTLKGTRSMLQMQLLQPELKRIQSKYGPGERQKMNEELMAFYQENGINPLGGCLPLLVQLPVFLVLFGVVRGMTRRATDIGTQLGWTSGRDLISGPFDLSTLDPNERVFDPEYIPVDSGLHSDLVNSNEMISFGIDLSRSASSVISDGLIDVLPYLGLMLVVLVSSLYQQRQIQGRNTGAQINPQQQAIMKIMPYFLPVFSYAMPAALVVYFVVSNLYRIGQQAYITQSLYSHDESPGAQLARERAKGGAKGDDGGSGARTEGKGRPTPKRSEARSGRAPGTARARSSRGRTRGEKSGGSGSRKRSAGTGDARGGRADATKGGAKGAAKGAAKGKSSAKGAAKGAAKGKSSAKGAAKGKSSAKGAAKGKSSAKGSGAGRTGRAPTRHGGGRTTDPGSQADGKKKNG